MTYTPRESERERQEQERTEGAKGAREIFFLLTTTPHTPCTTTDLITPP